MAMFSKGLIDKSLQEEFEKVKKTTTSILFVQASGEKMAITKTGGTINTRLEEWMDEAGAMIDDNTPAFILVRGEPGEDALWVLINFVPDDAPIKLKMKNSTFKSLVKAAFGEKSFFDDWQVSEAKEVSKAAFMERHNYKEEDEEAAQKREEKAACLEARIEEVLLDVQELMKEEAAALKKADAAEQQATLPKPVVPPPAVRGVAFALSEDAKSAIEVIAKGSSSWLQLVPDFDASELVQGVPSTAAPVKPEEIAVLVDSSKAGIYVWSFSQSEGGGGGDNKALIFLCVPEELQAKQKMLLRSSKATVVEYLVALNVTVVSTVSVEGPEDVQPENVVSEMEAMPPRWHTAASDGASAKPRVPHASTALKLPGM